MPFYDFFCKECEILVEDEFFKITDEKNVMCKECDTRMEQVLLRAPGLSDPGGTGQKWTNEGYQMRDEASGNLRIVKEKWEKGKNVIRSDVHKDDPGAPDKRFSGHNGKEQGYNVFQTAVENFEVPTKESGLKTLKGRKLDKDGK